MTAAKKPAAKAAEVKDVPKSIEVNGLKLKLPAKIPFRVLEFMDGEEGPSQVRGLLRVLLGDEQLQKVWDLDLSMDEGQKLVGDITDLYGVDAGK